MSVEEFRDRDADYLGWVAAHRDAYVINIGRSGPGYARLHRVTCGTITSRPPFTGPYIKVCSTALTELDRWALQRSGTVAKRYGTCQPPGSMASGQQAGPAEPATSVRADHDYQPDAPAPGQEWEIEGPDGDQRQLWLWDTRHIPYDRLPPGQHAARDALRLRVRSLATMAREILHASYTGAKPVNMDVENLLLYNIDSTACGCFRSAAGMGCALRWRPPPARSAVRPALRLLLPLPADQPRQWPGRARHRGWSTGAVVAAGVVCCRGQLVAGFGQGGARPGVYEAGGAARERVHRGH